MKTAVICYGHYGHPGENWFPWLKGKLEELGFNVVVPNFPTPENMSLQTWLKVFEEFKPLLDEESLLIGHSVGSTFLLTVLEQLQKPVKAVFLVSGLLRSVRSEEFNPFLVSFWDKQFDWQKIKVNAPHFFVFHADNDPYIPLEQAEELAEKLDTELILVKGAGHFNESTGYKEFPLLLKKVNSL
jgi:predicted alpha/beta hydrolase family esterase